MVGVNYWQFELHPRLMQKTLDGALAAGVKQILPIGTVYPYGRAQSASVREDQPRNPPTFKGRIRKAQKDIVMQAAADGGIKATVLRLPDFDGSGVEASLIHGAPNAAVNGGTADRVGPPEFVYVPHVGPVVLKLANTPAAYGKIWNFAGAGATTQADLVQKMQRQVGRTVKRRIAGKTMLRLIGLFRPVIQEFVEMHYLQTNPLIMGNSALQQLIGSIRKTSYSEGVRQTLAALQSAQCNVDNNVETIQNIKIRFGHCPKRCCRCNVQTPMRLRGALTHHPGDSRYDTGEDLQMRACRRELGVPGCPSDTTPR